MEGDSGLDVLSNDGILDIIPPSEYDPFEAKFCASLFWLVFHATEDGGLEDVPSQVTSPIQRLDKKNGFVVHPEIVEFLCKGEVYCTVCARIFPGKVMLAGHWSVIQTLSRNGVYVVDHTDIAVTDASLEKMNPFNQGAHIALMDALMTAYSSQVVSIQSVVQAVRRFSTFSASRELPFDLEDALLLWINKTNMAVNAKYTQPNQSMTGKLLRNREQVKKTGLRSDDDTVIVFPIIEDLLKGLCNGRSLLGVLMFYEPNVINFEDIRCSAEITTEDSVRNLDVFLGLCSQYFCTSVLALKVEDILYGSPSLKINIVALLAEMFSKCEGDAAGNVKPEKEHARSKTACSQNGEVMVNGGHNAGAGTRSHSAPITRKLHNSEKFPASNTLPESGNTATVKNARYRHDDSDIALKIQNYVENESLNVGIPSREKHVPAENMTSAMATSSNVTSTEVPPMTSSCYMTSSDDLTPTDESTVEVQGVVVKLRKKVSRNVEPGGGHEALLSRRMKKSLCDWSQENSSEMPSQTISREEQIDLESNELPPPPSVTPDDPIYPPLGLTNHPEHESPRDTEHDFNLDLHSLPEIDPPVDMLSPISETTEPGGSAGNSLNNSMSSTHEQREAFRQSSAGEKSFNFNPPKAHTPRKAENSRQRDDLMPRGSYIITEVNHTPETAFAAGIPIVERESLKSTAQSSDAALLYRSSFSNGTNLTNGVCDEKTHGEPSDFNDQRYVDGARSSDQQYSFPDSARKSSTGANQPYPTIDMVRASSNERFSDGAREQPNTADQRHHHKIYAHSNNNDQRLRSGGGEQGAKSGAQGDLESGDQRHQVDLRSDGRDDNRFLTYTKKKSSRKENGTESGSSDAKLWVKDQGEQIHRENSLGTDREDDGDTGPLLVSWFGHAKSEEESMRYGEDHLASESRVKKTNWGEMAFEVNESSDVIKRGPSNDSSKPDPVSRELNLLRLRLAEKQRDIEAQKQRTKEQLDEERKRFGQNVFWLAVGKGRERKEGNEAKASQHRQDLLVNQNSNVQRSEPTNNNKVATFTKQSSLDGDLPPSMGRLQDRSFDIKANNINSSKPLPEDKASQRFVENRNPSLEHRVTSVEDQNTSEDVVQFRLSRQAPTKTLTDNSDLQNSEKPKTPVLNYKSRMNVPVSIQAKPVSENFADSQNSQDLAVDGLGPDEGECSEVQSQRKCWDTGTANNNESNARLFGKSSNSNVEAPQSLVMSGSPGVSDSSAQDEQSPEGGSESPHSSPVEDDRETPKKGLALFIGEENAARNNDGLTPEQLRKREKFLRNRQQKIEEEKIKKEALLEKKKRKDEKMREIQLRREEEEQSRQAKLQEKRHQAEHAKQERERYELRKKENLPRTNIVDGGYASISQGIDRVPGGNAGYNKTTVDILGIEGGKGGYTRTVAKTSGENAFEIHAPAQNTTSSAFSGFTGVQSYVKPSGKTNRKLIINAISHVCLPGVVNKDTKDKCLQAMTESSAQHFLILFKDGLKFRALYSLDLESNQVLKVYGIGPRSVTEKMTEQLYKYNSGGKEFSKIPAKGFSLSVDGFTLHKSCWQSNKPPVASKTSSNFKQSSYRPTR
ncbi:calmodulin-regulated spectrin-associated protein 1-B-like isoform X2 [Dendronephthya gigantea]|uniref:calmodulin-regulated spectrin-associated protein 1-B-like isoform X2 n=1 Tax=Dendronephthya gigantea TaxID=151771 RepID=UPI00106C618D|nr:calmodulin-regulated spectrin-associated protein 1-B-like isoform X2 [Dendronephthya gigantea]